MWLPQRKYEDDVNIMESAIRDKKYTKKKRFKLQAINNCQMYLGVILLSELIGNNGKISIDDMNSNMSQKNTKYNDRR